LPLEPIRGLLVSGRGPRVVRARWVFEDALAQGVFHVLCVMPAGINVEDVKVDESRERVYVGIARWSAVQCFPFSVEVFA
jgi:hypothetical protein